MIAHPAGEFGGRGLLQGQAGDEEACAFGFFAGAGLQSVAGDAQGGGRGGEGGGLGFEAYGAQFSLLDAPVALFIFRKRGVVFSSWVFTVWARVGWLFLTERM